MPSEYAYFTVESCSTPQSLSGCGAVAVRFALCLALESIFPGTGISIFCLQFIVGELIGQVITGGNMKKMAIVLKRGICKARNLAGKALSLLVSKAESTTEAVNSMVMGVKRISVRYA